MKPAMDKANGNKSRHLAHQPLIKLSRTLMHVCVDLKTDTMWLKNGKDENLISGTNCTMHFLRRLHCKPELMLQIFMRITAAVLNGAFQ